MRCSSARRAALAARGVEPEYVALVDPETLEPLETLDAPAPAGARRAHRRGAPDRQRDPVSRRPGRPPHATGKVIRTMQRVMLKSKIHRATITDCDLHYVGSITIDPDLLEAADILEHEQVHVRRRRQRRALRDLHDPGPSAARARSASTAPPPAWCTAATRSSSSPTPATTTSRARALRAARRPRRGRRPTASSPSTTRWRPCSPERASTGVREEPSAMSSHPTIQAPADPGRLPMTLPLLAEKKRLGDPIVMVTAYDYPSARAAEAAGVDLVLVGDSAATTVLGYNATTPVELDDMLVLARAVRRGLTHAAADRRPAVRLLRGLRRAGDHDRDAHGQGGRLRRRQARGRRRGLRAARARDRRRRHPRDGPRRPDAADLDGARRLEGAGPHRRGRREDRRTRRSRCRRPAASRSSSRRFPAPSPRS